MASKSPLQQWVADVWATTLKISEPELDDDFYALGGTSLAAVRIVFVVRDRLGVELPLRALLDSADLAAFCAEIDRRAEPGAALLERLA
ncbi:phosphopantetheine-binding protein [Actinomadura gamaensis]|uniref:Phosphopantetheine-binding protein n=1 Tax=Actinomadura gamaensis TaxID=1763541 RepID=A0ABV9TXU0_9ACTN